MSLLTDASLVLTPNAYKEGKLYSVIPSNGNGDFTATRATTATRVNSSGLVDLVPYNRFSYSEMFSDSSWAKARSTISANVTTAPNGTLTADKIIEDTTATNSHRIGQLYTFTIGLAHTISCYAKAAERTQIGLSFNIVPTTTTDGVIFDLLSGTIVLQTTGYTGTITSVGDGWYRCTATKIADATSLRGDIALAVGGTAIYTGNGTSGLFIWGAQLVEGTSARDYLRTETRLNIPRIDYSLGGCPNILLEPQRTNLCTYSEELNNATFWIRTAGVSVNANTSNSPSGTLTADTIVGATGTGGWATPNVFQRSIPLLSSTTYTFSVYIKGSGSVTLQLRDQSTGNLTSLVCNLTSSWQRFELSRTTGASTTALGIIFGSATGNFDAWGAQLEQGAYATSYIPTTTASVTRNADTLTRNNIFTNGLITSAGGTWFVELRNNRAILRDAFSASLGIGNTFPSPSSGLYLAKDGSAVTAIQFRKLISSVETTLFTIATGTVKLAVKWNGSTADVFQNGVKVINATAFTPTALEFLFGNGNDIPKFINEMALFPTPLTDAQCIALTQ